MLIIVMLMLLLLTSRSLLESLSLVPVEHIMMSGKDMMLLKEERGISVICRTYSRERMSLTLVYP